MTGWQPIATAPRDGRFVDLWHRRDQRRYADCRWRCRESKLPAGETVSLWAWFAQSGGRAFNVGTDEDFSHWREPPGPPGEID